MKTLPATQQTNERSFSSHVRELSFTIIIWQELAEKKIDVNEHRSEMSIFIPK